MFPFDIEDEEVDVEVEEAEEPAELHWKYRKNKERSSHGKRAENNKSRACTKKA